MAKPDALIQFLDGMHSFLGFPIPVKAIVEGSDVLIEGIEFPRDCWGETCQPHLKMIVSEADNLDTRLKLTAEAFAKLSDDGVTLSDLAELGFIGLVRDPIPLSEVTLVYVAETGAGPFLSHTVHRRKSLELMSRAGSRAHTSLQDTERAACRSLRIFQVECAKFIRLARDRGEDVEDWVFDDRKTKRYKLLGNHAVEPQLELERSYVALITFASMVDDRVCNLALDLREQTSGQVWGQILLDEDRKRGSGRMRDRTAARKALYSSFALQGGDKGALRRLQLERNELLHAHYGYSFVQLDPDDVLLSGTFALEAIDPLKPSFVAATDVLTWLKVLLDSYLVWFLDESERQIADLGLP